VSPSRFYDTMDTTNIHGGSTLVIAVRVGTEVRRKVHRLGQHDAGLVLWGLVV
jgi:hypothetical protein